MDIRDALKNNYQTSQMVCGAYLGDLTDEESMKRPHAGCNHVNWQVGHIIASEHGMAGACAEGALPALPEGFAEKYSKETACLLYTSPSPRDQRGSRMPSSA